MISDMSKIQPFLLEFAQDVNLQCLSPCMIPGELKESGAPKGGSTFVQELQFYLAAFYRLRAVTSIPQALAA